MADLKAELEKWTKAAKPAWKKSLREIEALRSEQIKSKGNEKLTSALRDYFTDLKKLILLAASLEPFIHNGFKQKQLSLQQLKKWQNVFFADLNPDKEAKQNYAHCFGNPQYAQQRLGTELGNWLCLLYGSCRNYPALLIQQRYNDLLNLNTLILNLAALAEDFSGSAQQLKKWQQFIRNHIVRDLDKNQLFNFYWRYSPEADYYKNIVLKADLTDLTYLFRYGVYINDHVLKLAKFMQEYPEQELKRLAHFIVQAYEDGFTRGNRSYKIKKYTNLIIPAGMERLGRLLIKELDKIGLEPVVAPPFTQSFNKQFDYDRRFAFGLYYDDKFTSIQTEAYGKACEKMHDLLDLQAGPVYIELFGETPFSPKDNPAAFQLSQEQRRLLQETSSVLNQIFSRHYKRETTSFCIIAFPSPEIGRNFRRIFADTVRINTLDSLHYAALQQKIIDVLDTAEYVHVKGVKGNQTDIMVKLHPLKNPEKETNFENCVADVNIPVGEVFTSPLLKGTNGTLHVKEVYLGNLLFKNLKIVFKDGMIADYDCSNFKAKDKNRKFVEENLLLPHKTLPIGEFAIGTNTTAYQVAHKYGILGLLPILIIEKMGPHFAVGDTCYSREEDIDHFNFYNGKKLIAVDNEKSALRKKDPLQAYTLTHTDITLPYEMLQSISAVRKDGSAADIIRNGLFVVPGTEELNEPILQVRKMTKATKKE